MFPLLLAAMLSSPAETSAPAADADKVVCKSEPVLGSRLKTKKTCKTKAEWKAHAEAMAAQRRDMQNTAGSNQ